MSQRLRAVRLAQGPGQPPGRPLKKRRDISRISSMRLRHPWVAAPFSRAGAVGIAIAATSVAIAKHFAPATGEAMKKKVHS
ncbi:hypothetical protein ACSMEB_14250 [Stenotrophomonas maltophilia]|uniref:hypothetical protein n=1 Tax=Stenotrophomonas maltophilia TaxID=40324 RepID=UPI001378978A|nr:hypothetical protein [Stenotrophomonas maltophilia]WNV16717.1 hypothetical protein RS400_09310 [Stenotrophomonas maltophilia]